MSTDINKQRMLIIEYWFRTLIEQNTEITIKDIIPIIIEYAEAFKMLPFHLIFKSQAITLSDDNKCATKTAGSSNIYILADDDPVKTGIHVWRVKVKWIIMIYLLNYLQNN